MHLRLDEACGAKADDAEQPLELPNKEIKDARGVSSEAGDGAGRDGGGTWDGGSGGGGRGGGLSLNDGSGRDANKCAVRRGAAQ